MSDPVNTKEVDWTAGHAIYAEVMKEPEHSRYAVIAKAIQSAKAVAWEEGRVSTVRMVKGTLINAGWEPADIGTFEREANPYPTERA